jgi:PilZ domain
MRKLRPRRYERVRHLHEVNFRNASGGVVSRGYTIDLSPSGTRLFSALPLAVGETIELAWPHRDPAVSLVGRVVHVRVEVEGNCAGVQFYPPLSPEVFQNLRDLRRT